MPSWLCKIWRLIANIVDKVLSVIFGAVKKLLDLAVAALDSLAEALGIDSTLFKWIAFGIGAYFLFGMLANNKDESDPVSVQIGEQ